MLSITRVPAIRIALPISMSSWEPAPSAFPEVFAPSGSAIPSFAAWAQIKPISSSAVHQLVRAETVPASLGLKAPIPHTPPSRLPTSITGPLDTPRERTLSRSAVARASPPTLLCWHSINEIRDSAALHVRELPLTTETTLSAAQLTLPADRMDALLAVLTLVSRVLIVSSLNLCRLPLAAHPVEALARRP